MPAAKQHTHTKVRLAPFSLKRLVESCRCSTQTILTHKRLMNLLPRGWDGDRSKQRDLARLTAPIPAHPTDSLRHWHPEKCVGPTTPAALAAISSPAAICRADLGRSASMRKSSLGCAFEAGWPIVSCHPCNSLLEPLMVQVISRIPSTVSEDCASKLLGDKAPAHPFQCSTIPRCTFSAAAQRSTSSRGEGFPAQCCVGCRGLFGSVPTFAHDRRSLSSRS